MPRGLIVTTESATEVLYKKALMKNFPIFTEKHLFL